MVHKLQSLIFVEMFFWLIFHFLYFWIILYSRLYCMLNFILVYVFSFFWIICTFWIILNYVESFICCCSLVLKCAIDLSILKGCVILNNRCLCGLHNLVVCSFCYFLTQLFYFFNKRIIVFDFIERYKSYSH